MFIVQVLIQRRAIKNSGIQRISNPLYTRYPIVARVLGLAAVQPLGRVRRASKGILHTIEPPVKKTKQMLIVTSTITSCTAFLFV